VASLIVVGCWPAKLGGWRFCVLAASRPSMFGYYGDSMLAFQATSSAPIDGATTWHVRGPVMELSREQIGTGAWRLNNRLGWVSIEAAAGFGGDNGSRTDLERTHRSYSEHAGAKCDCLACLPGRPAGVERHQHRNV
jgi:hypothetical protein